MARPRIQLAPVFLAAILSLGGCNLPNSGTHAISTGGDRLRGKAAIDRYGCGSCHTIQGISRAHGLVGPPLTGLPDRMYIAGKLENTPGNLIRWIRDPQAITPGTAMPVLAVSEQDAADIAAYIYSIP